MIKRALQVFSEKYGHIVDGPHVIPGGVSKKSGKNYDSFATLDFLEYNAKEVKQIQISMDCLETFQKKLDVMPYLQGVCITGNSDASGHFLATDITTFDFDAE